MADVERELTVKIPTAKPEGKVLTLKLEGEQVEIDTPISWGLPRVALADLEAAVHELKGGGG